MKSTPIITRATLPYQSNLISSRNRDLSCQFQNWTTLFAGLGSRLYQHILTTTGWLINILIRRTNCAARCMDTTYRVTSTVLSASYHVCSARICANRGRTVHRISLLLRLLLMASSLTSRCTPLCGSPSEHFIANHIHCTGFFSLITLITLSFYASMGQSFSRVLKCLPAFAEKIP
jgi:hypothetical protein